MALQGTFSYPGIGMYESFDFTDLSGITPAVALVTIYLEGGFPDANGDAELEYGDNTVTIKYMHVDSVSYHSDCGGQTATVRLLDERWAWSFYQVTGYYNLRLPNGLVDPDHEKSPRELATMLFQILGVDAFDVELLPDDARPECNWENANAASELERIVTQLGCKIVPVRSEDLWRIVVTGEGADLPDDFPNESPGVGIDPKETPDFIKVVTAPIRYQVCLELKACSRDTDHSWKDLQDISFKPTTPSGRDDYYVAEFGFEPTAFAEISPIRYVQPDGTATSPQEIALANVFRKWRISDTPTNVTASVDTDGTKKFLLPGFGKMVTRKQILPANELVESYTDDRDVDHRRPSYIMGEFNGEHCEKGMYPAGTRIDYQGAVYIVSPEEPSSFSMSIDPIDTDRTIVSTSKQMMTYFQPSTTSAASPYGAAKIFLTCAVTVRDPEKWQPLRYEKKLQIGNGNNEEFCHVLRQEDIQPWVISEYDKDGKPTGTAPRTNKSDVDQMCDYYLNSYAKTFEIVDTAHRTYIGLFSIDMDGAIAQVQWTISKGGASTIVSRGTEHNFQIPTHEQRLQRNATRSDAALSQYQDFRSARRERVLGTSNTI